MKEELIKFETAKLAKEKGFKLGSEWQIRLLYNLPDGKTFCEKTKETPEYACEAPTQALLQKWLREEHQLFVEVFTNVFGKTQLVKVRRFNKRERLQSSNIESFGTYEQALEAGLVKALKLLNNINI